MIKCKCNKCGIKKPESAFCRDASRKSGHSNRCRTCMREYNAARYQRIKGPLNEERRAARVRARTGQNVEDLVAAGYSRDKANRTVAALAEARAKLARGKALRDAARAARATRIKATKSKLNLADMLK